MTVFSCGFWYGLGLIGVRTLHTRFASHKGRGRDRRVAVTFPQNRHLVRESSLCLHHRRNPLHSRRCLPS